MPPSAGRRVTFKSSFRLLKMDETSFSDLTSWMYFECVMEPTAQGDVVGSSSAIFYCVLVVPFVCSLR
jgi:hypothetical protein